MIKLTDTQKNEMISHVEKYTIEEMKKQVSYKQFSKVEEGMFILGARSAAIAIIAALDYLQTAEENLTQDN